MMEQENEQRNAQVSLSPEGAAALEAARARELLAAAQRQAAAERAGSRLGGLLGSVGSKLEGPTNADDDLRDLFTTPDMDRDSDVYVEDLVTVTEEDVFGDGGEDMSDLLEVDGELDAPEQPEPPRVVSRPHRSRSPRSAPQDMLRGLGG